MPIIRSKQLKDGKVLDALNHRIKTKESKYLKVYNNSTLLVSIKVSDFKSIDIRNDDCFIGILSKKPYVYIFYGYNEFTHIIDSESYIMPSVIDNIEVD